MSAPHVSESYVETQGQAAQGEVLTDGGAKREGEWKVQGSATDGAILIAAHKAGLCANDLRAMMTKVDEVL